MTINIMPANYDASNRQGTGHFSRSKREQACGSLRECVQQGVRACLRFLAKPRFARVKILFCQGVMGAKIQCHTWLEVGGRAIAFFVESPTINASCESLWIVSLAAGFWPCDSCLSWL